MPDEETKRIMKDHGLDEEQAKKVQEIMEAEGFDEDEAVEILDDY